MKLRPPFPLRSLSLLFPLAALAAVPAPASGVPAEETPEPAAVPAAENPRAAFSPKSRSFVFGVPVKMSGEQLFLVDTKVNGVPAKMLVDTGASHTALDEAWAREKFPAAKLERLATASGGSVYAMPDQEVSLMPISEFSVGKNAFAFFSMPLVDLSGLRAALPELRDVVGVIGMNTLTLAPCRISFKERTFTWLSRKMLDATDGKKKLFARRLPGTDCFLLALFSPKDGKPLPALLDCGAAGTCVPADFWVGELPQKAYALSTTATGTQRIEITFGVPAELRFSDEFSLKNVSPELLPADGNAPRKILLGLDVLSRLELIFDGATESVFALPESDEAH